jgi:hypothetical protein
LGNQRSQTSAELDPGSGAGRWKALRFVARSNSAPTIFAETVQTRSKEDEPHRPWAVGVSKKPLSFIHPAFQYPEVPCARRKQVLVSDTLGEGANESMLLRRDE